MSQTPKNPREFSDINLLDALQFWARHSPAQNALIFLGDAESVSMELNYAQLMQRIDTLAPRLSRYFKPGDRAILSIENEAEFLISLLACLHAGIIAIPSLSPNNERSIKRIEAHLLDSAAAAVLLDSQALRQLRMKRDAAAVLEPFCVNIEELPETNDNEENAARPCGDESIAYLQYTSGSTRSPRGVTITHGNLNAQQRMLMEALNQQPHRALVNWMPLYHDFGLVMSLQAFRAGGCCVLLPAARVVQQPIRWLRAIERFQAPISAGATFMFSHCVRKVRDEQRRALDLSCWRQVIIGAEPIHADIVREFSVAYKNYGFKESVFWPAYGMAEATLVITGRGGETPVFRRFDTAALQQRRVVQSTSGQELVSSGQICFPGSVRVVDPETHTVCPPDVIGELWVKNPCVGKGYWQQPEATQETFGAYLGTDDGPYLRTGDLGFIHEQEVFISGRLKDIIIINGENRYPQDIEWTVGHCHPALEPGAGVALGIEADGSERLAIVYEIRRTARKDIDADALVGAIRAAVVKNHGIDVHTIVLIPPANLPKTSSGKVQRQVCKQRLLTNDLAGIVHWSVSLPSVSAASSAESEALLQLCRKILNAPLLGLNDDLFAQGADSIKSMELIAEIEARWQCGIPLQRFNEEPTVNCLLALIREVKDPESTAAPEAETGLAAPQGAHEVYLRQSADASLHAILAYTSAWRGKWMSPNRLLFGFNMQGAKPPLFWCCQGFHELSQLAKYLGDDQPLYGMRSGHLAMEYNDKESVAALAGWYVKEILTNCPQPMYWLGGNCQGGGVVTRMAQMLAGLGECVRQVFILENIAPRVSAEVLPFKIALFYGRDSIRINPYLQFPAPDSAWKKLYPLGYSLDIINARHGRFFDVPYIDDFANKLKMRLRESQTSPVFRALPNAAFAAQIDVQSESVWRAGEQRALRVRVKNTSPMPWRVYQQSGLIAANHWLGEDEQPAQWLDGYAPLTEALLPQQETVLILQVAVPETPGAYILEIDLAEQGIVWFKEKGNPPYRLEVQVSPAL